MIPGQSRRHAEMNLMSSPSTLVHSASSNDQRDAVAEGESLERTRDDEERLCRMLSAFFPAVWRLGRRMGLSDALAEEVAQEAFVVASKRLARIDPGLERSFLYGVTLRLIANQRRSAVVRHESESYDPTLHDVLQTHPGADELLELKQRRMLLDQVLDSMPTPFREVLVLFEIDECSLGEIAATLHIPEGTAASRLRRARDDFARRVQRLRAVQSRTEEAP